MDRRDFLKATATGAIGVAALDSGCAAGQAAHGLPSVSLDSTAVEATLSRIDERMAGLARLELLPEGLVAQDSLLRERADVARGASRSFYITGAFLELSEQDRAHPGVQERVRRMLPEMDRAVFGMADLLESLTADERRLVQEQLRSDRELGARVAQMFEEPARDDGFSLRRRLDLRAAFDGLARRMRAQNPQLVFEPYIRKVRKIQANPGTDAERTRKLAARVGEQAFWEFQERSARHVKAWDELYQSRPRVDLAGLDAVYPLEPDPEAGGEDPTAGAKKVLKVGAYIMGFGLLSELIGLLFYGLKATDAALVFGVTVGPILLAVGLVVVIVGAIIYLAKRP